jgi:sporulation protein YlmC with PRC-barrel domain
MNPAVLKGKKVVGNEGYILGEMNDLNFDLEKWQATAFCVVLNAEASAELGFKKPFLRRIMICLPTKLIKAIGDVVTLTIPVKNLKDITEKEMEVAPVKIAGKKVVSTKGYSVGEVEALDVDFSNWQVNGLQVGLTDDAATELGFKRPVMSKVTVIIPSSAVEEIGNFITLDKSIENLKSLVECIRSCQQQK